jgi:hypothetical protein
MRTLIIAILCVLMLASMAFAQGNGARGSVGMMFGDASGPFLNLSIKLSSQDSFNLMGSAGIGFDDGWTLIPLMVSIEPQPRESTSWYVGAGLGMLIANGNGWSDSAFAYQGYAGYNFTPKVFGEFKLIGAEGATLEVISVGTKF